MTCFSKQRYCATFSSILKALLLCLLTLGFSLSAEEGEAPYRGTWQINTPDEGALILLVKRNGQASYFWGDNTDRSVYQGTWSSDESAATLKWPDGSTHRISSDALGHSITYRDAAGNEQYATQAGRVPKEILGQWAKAPSTPDEQVSDRDKAKGFFGTWKIGTGTDAYYVVVEPNRSAASTWNSGTATKTGLRGSWARQGRELHLAWDSGQYGILQQNERNFSFKLIPPGAIIGKDKTASLNATRTSDANLPTEWSASYQTEKENQAGGIAFSSRKDANIFYRGHWIVQRSTESFERIEIGRFGGLSTSADRSLEGNWRMTGQDIFMRWDNGMRKLLSPVGQGFLLYEYQPGRPLDGVPTRIFPATPDDAAKLATHLQGRQAVAEQMLHLAEAAGATTTPAGTGWGQTFMRWAWPFSDDGPQSTEALLQESFETSATLDPWWWPFWSEKPIGTNAPVAETSQEVETETIEVEIVEPATAAAANAAEGTGATATEGAANQKQASKPTKQNWKWPF